ncbi:MAG: hypothetical protein EBW13_04855 [Actinobacteria bacterium]|nr:hypothetical protein [Actinomycetota bacterium]
MHQLIPVKGRELQRLVRRCKKRLLKFPSWTLLSGIVSVIYNMFAEYVGGWEVTLTDDL